MDYQIVQWVDFFGLYAKDFAHDDVWCAFGMHCPEMIERIKTECKRVNGFVPYQPGYVYCIQAIGTGYYKLGKTMNPDRRLLQIAPKMPFSTRFVKVWPTNFMDLAEKWLHQEFAEYRANGEWFEIQAGEFYKFFVDDEGSFDDQIRHIYCAYFFENLKVPGLFEALNTVSASMGSDLFTYKGSAELIAWIEGLFSNSAYSDFGFTSEISSQYALSGNNFPKEVLL